MDSRKKFFRKVYIVLYYLAVAIVLTYVVAIAFNEKVEDNEKVRSFSDGWITEEGTEINLTKTFTGTFTVHRNLPNDLTDRDALCFETNNSNVMVWVDDELLYEFKSRENFTGWGYGFAFHYVELRNVDSGKKVTIRYDASVEDDKDVRLMGAYISPVSGYVHKVVRGMVVPFALSATILLFGIILLFIQIAIGLYNILPFSMSSLAAMSIILGLWGIVDTNVIQLLTGRIYTFRFLYVVLPFLVCYPMLCFLNSITQKKRLIYRHLSFAISTTFLVFIPMVRYIVGLDLANIFFRLMTLEIFLSVVLMACIIIDDRIYCSKKGIRMGIRNVIPGLIALMICMVIDVAIFMFKIRITDNSAIFTRFGLLTFIFILMGQFLKWWTKDQAAIERDRFINRALQYAVSSNSPDVSIMSMIGFLGKEFQAAHVFIFEDQKNGKYRGTYEWSDENHEPASVELIYVPYEGIVDRVYEGFKRHNHRLIVDDPENYRTSIPSFYNLLKTNHMNNMVIAPLEIGNNIFGVWGVSGVPQGSLESIAEIMDLISYFLAQLILQREEQNRALFYSYNDVLTGAGNHMAYRKFIEKGLDTSSAFGFMRCDLLGLDTINVTQGYEVGDQIVILTAKFLMEVFGEQHVYRMNGTQFAVFGFETEEIFFNNDVDRAKRLLKENGIEAVTASVYCVYGTKDIHIVLKRADDLIQDSMP